MRHAKSSGVRVLKPEILGTVAVNAQVFTDQHGAHRSLWREGYNHRTINHSIHQYVEGNTHTQNVENLWSNIKRGIYGVYKHVDPKYLQAYVDEYAFRYSNRDNPQMFDAVLTKVSS